MPPFRRKPRPTSPQIERARDLRQRMTVPERLLWSILRNRRLGGLKFVRQKPMAGFVLDYYCAERRLVVEVDGVSHLGREQYDAERTARLEAMGLHVVRVSNDDVCSNLEGVAQFISRAAKLERSTSVEAPSP